MILKIIIYDVFWGLEVNNIFDGLKTEFCNSNSATLVALLSHAEGYF